MVHEDEELDLFYFLVDLHQVLPQVLYLALHFASPQELIVGLDDDQLFFRLLGTPLSSPQEVEVLQEKVILLVEPVEALLLVVDSRYVIALQGVYSPHKYGVDHRVIIIITRLLLAFFLRAFLQGLAALVIIDGLRLSQDPLDFLPSHDPLPKVYRHTVKQLLLKGGTEWEPEGQFALQGLLGQQFGQELSTFLHTLKLGGRQAEVDKLQ
jgi:hypothetical protein